MKHDTRIQLTRTILASLEKNPLTLREVSTQHNIPHHVAIYLMRVLRKSKVVTYEDKKLVVQKTNLTDDEIKSALFSLSRVGVNNKFKCRVCETVKDYIPGTKKMSNGRFYRVDKEGRRWCRQICPDCSEDIKTPKQLTKRKCRMCSNFLPPERYFNCITCIPQDATTGIDEDWILHT